MSLFNWSGYSEDQKISPQRGIITPWRLDKGIFWKPHFMLHSKRLKVKL
jgi:hypothetical protein